MVVAYSEGTPVPAYCKGEELGLMNELLVAICLGALRLSMTGTPLSSLSLSLLNPFLF
jgi:hypothetical protein